MPIAEPSSGPSEDASLSSALAQTERPISVGAPPPSPSGRTYPTPSSAPLERTMIPSGYPSVPIERTFSSPTPAPGQQRKIVGGILSVPIGHTYSSPTLASSERLASIVSPPLSSGERSSSAPGQNLGTGIATSGGQIPTLGDVDLERCERELQMAIAENSLEQFYGPLSRGELLLSQIAADARKSVDTIAERWQIPRETAVHLARLALYDIVLYIDDSFSMAFEENGERINALKFYTENIAATAILFSSGDIKVRFMNDRTLQNDDLNHIRSMDHLRDVLNRISYAGLTPIGTKLRELVLTPFISTAVRSRTLRRPLLILCVTDGQPAGEEYNVLSDVLKETYALCTAPITVPMGSNAKPYGRGAVAYSFLKVGSDPKAADFLRGIDRDMRKYGVVSCSLRKSSLQRRWPLANRNKSIGRRKAFDVFYFLVPQSASWVNRCKTQVQVREGDVLSQLDDKPYAKLTMHSMRSPAPEQVAPYRIRDAYPRVPSREATTLWQSSPGVEETSDLHPSNQQRVRASQPYQRRQGREDLGNGRSHPPADDTPGSDSTEQTRMRSSKSERNISTAMLRDSLRRKGRT